MTGAPHHIQAAGQPEWRSNPVAAALLRVLPLWSVVTALWLMLAAPAYAQLEAQLDLETSNGYGRIVITFSDRPLLPSYDLRTNNGVLVLDWDQPVRIDLGRTAQDLAGFVTVVRQDSDNGALRFALSRDVRINTMEAGERLFIDFLPPNWSGPPPELPAHIIEELAERARLALERAQRAERRLEGVDQLRLKLNVGLNPTFTRFSFEWNAPFDSSFVRKGDEVLIGFDQAAALDVSQIRANPPPGLADILTEERDGELNVLLVVDPRADVRAFKIDNRYVVDVTNPDGPREQEDGIAIRAAVDAPLPSGAELGQVITTRGDTAPTQTLATMTSAPSATQSPPLPSAAPVQSQRDELAEQPVQTAAQVPSTNAAVEDLIPSTSAEATSTAPVTPAPRAQTGGSTVRVMNVPPSVPSNFSNGQALITQSEMPLSQAAAPEAATHGETAIPTAVPLSGPRGYAEAAPGADDSGADTIRVNANRVGNVVRMVFPFERETPGAVFQRGNSVWAVFETQRMMTLDAARIALADYARNMDIRQIDGATILRIDLAERYLAGFGIDATSIVLTIGDRVMDPSTPLDVLRSYRGDGALTLKVPFARASRVFEIQDPLVGDILHVATGFGPARGLLKSRRFAELSTLVSAHGVAHAPNADDVETVIAGDAVIISRPEGLRLSFSQVEGGTSLQDRDEGGLTGEFIEFSELHIANPHKFTGTVRALELAVAEADAHEVTDRRLDLIRFFLANRFAFEALAQLRIAADDDPRFEQSPGYHVLTGAAQILAHRETAAARHLSRPDLLGRADAAVWQTITYTHMHDWTKASDAALIGETVIGNFPHSLQATFFLAAARSATEVNDYGSAARFLSQIEPGLIDHLLAAEYDYLRGRVAHASGRPEIAVRLWELAGASRNEAVGAEATLDMLKFQHAEQRVPVDEIIREVEHLTFSWRGDETEIKSLHFLSQLYAEEERYRDAFQSLEAALLAAPNSDTTRLMQEEMAATFASLFLDDAAKDMDPVKSLALFYDYRSMVPIGRKGDEMVRELASRLVDLDLLDQAAELLKHQVDNRLEGAASAQVATELALVHILNHKPDAALNALARTRVARLPHGLQRQRRILEARALGDIGRHELALDLLAGMNGPDAQRLRAENLWALKRWSEAGHEYEAIPGSRWKDGLALTSAERQDVLRAAISFSLAGDQLSTERVRGKFAEQMSNGPDAAGFDVVTSELTVDSVQFREIATEIANTDTFETFLNEYRRQYDPSLEAPPQQIPPPFGEGQPDPIGVSTEAAANAEDEAPIDGVAPDEAPAEDLTSDRGPAIPQPTAQTETADQLGAG